MIGCGITNDRKGSFAVVQGNDTPTSARRDTDPINGSIALPFFSDMKILLDPVVTTGIKLLIFKLETQIGLPGSNCHGNLW